MLCTGELCITMLVRTIVMLVINEWEKHSLSPSGRNMISGTHNNMYLLHDSLVLWRQRLLEGKPHRKGTRGKYSGLQD